MLRESQDVAILPAPGHHNQTFDRKESRLLNLTTTDIPLPQSDSNSDHKLQGNWPASPP
jgi:mRNA-degrading endonuclease YafQ of YafQ-DinJ toxin-antitoxin module